MTDKHTPGPWATQAPENDGTIFIIGSNLGGLVGAAHCWPTETETCGSDRVRANARLIAAAPDMLEALKLAQEAMDYMGDVLNGMDAATPEDVAATTPAFDAARAAITKATGSDT